VSQLLVSAELQVKAGDKVSITLSRHDTSIRASCFVLGSREPATVFDLQSNATLSDIYACVDKQIRHRGLHVAGFFTVPHMEWKDSLESLLDLFSVAKIQADVCSTRDCKEHLATTLLERPECDHKIPQTPYKIALLQQQRRQQHMRWKQQQLHCSPSLNFSMQGNAGKIKQLIL
jgi:hypothetical protein